MSKFEVERSLLGRTSDGVLTSSEEDWVDGPTFHNILLLERETDDTSELVLDIDVPIRFPLIADILESTLSTFIAFGFINAG